VAEPNPLRLLTEMGALHDYVRALERNNAAMRLEIERLKGNMPGGSMETPIVRAAQQPRKAPEPEPAPEPPPKAPDALPSRSDPPMEVETGDACGVCGQLAVVRQSSCRTLCRSCGAIDGGCG
jgi:hypothetical protein